MLINPNKLRMDSNLKETIIATLKELNIEQSIIEQVLVSTTTLEEAVELSLCLTEQQIDNQQKSGQNKNDKPKDSYDNPTKFEECKMVLLVRTDLGMSVGKIAAQVGHAGSLISSGFISGRSAKISRLCHEVGDLRPSQNCPQS